MVTFTLATGTHSRIKISIRSIVAPANLYGYFCRLLKHISTNKLIRRTLSIRTIEDSIVRIKNDVVRFERKIEEYENKDNKIDTTIQDKIKVEQERINTAYDGVNY